MFVLDGVDHGALSFEEALTRLAAADRGDTVYRGQGSSAWSLCPSLFRDPNGFTLDKQTRMRKLNRLSACVNEFVSEYERVFSTNHSNELSYQDKVALAQHHGVPTPLLDWTDSVLVALFMACAFWNGQDPSIRIFAVEKSEFIIENGAVLFDTPRFDPRQNSQRGFLSYSADQKTDEQIVWLPNPMDEVIDGERVFSGDIKYVDILLDKREQARIMRFLDRNRISFQTLFPDSLHWSVVQITRRHFV